MTQIYRTTKIPEFYFTQIEDYLLKTDEFVSVSEFIRDSIKEKLQKTNMPEYSLLSKQVVFNEQMLMRIHDIIIQNNTEKDILKPDMMQSIIDKSSDMDFIKFLSRFLINFAQIHPFEDGNKRTSWIAADVFLRLNNKKLNLKALTDSETDDEIFIWQNSANQKTIAHVFDFLKKHILAYKENSNELDKEIEKSIKENELLLKKLSR
jgi:Fic family protein